MTTKMTADMTMYKTGGLFAYFTILLGCFLAAATANAQTAQEQMHGEQEQ